MFREDLLDRLERLEKGGWQRGRIRRVRDHLGWSGGGGAQTTVYWGWGVGRKELL